MIDTILSLWLRRSRAVSFVVKNLSHLVAALPRYASVVNPLNWKPEITITENPPDCIHG